MRSPLATIAREHRGAEAERRVVGDANGVLVVLGLEDRGHRSEQLLVGSRHSLASLRRAPSPGRRRPDPRAPRRRAAAARPTRRSSPPAGAARRAGRGGRADRARSPRRWDRPSCVCAMRAVKRSSNVARHAAVDDEALGGDAALSAVDEPAGGAGRRRQLEVGVGEDEVGVAAAELEHRLLEQRARLGADRLPGGRRSGERRRAHARVLEHGVDSTRCRSGACGTGPRGTRPPRTPPRSRARRPGTFEACLSTAALPATSAGAAKRKTCQNGKFQGITASTTPIGSKATKLRAASVATSLRPRASPGLARRSSGSTRRTSPPRRAPAGSACPSPRPSAARRRLVGAGRGRRPRAPSAAARSATGTRRHCSNCRCACPRIAATAAGSISGVGPHYLPGRRVPALDRHTLSLLRRSLPGELVGDRASGDCRPWLSIRRASCRSRRVG